MATRTTVLRNTGLAAQAGEVLSKTGKQPVIRFARYTTAAGEQKVIKNVKIVKVEKARENHLLIVRTVDALGNFRSYNTGRLTHTQIPSL